MISRKYVVSMSAELLEEPVLYRLAKDFDIAPGVRRADVSRGEAWMTLELKCESEEQLQRGLDYMRGAGFDVKPLEGDYFEG